VQAQRGEKAMNEEPLIPQSVEHWTLDQLLSRSLEEWKKRLGLPSKIVEAEKLQQVKDNSKVTEVKEEGN
jgi:hypothetical protein